MNKKNVLIVSGTNLEDLTNGSSVVLRNFLKYIPNDFNITILNNGLMKDKKKYSKIKIYDFEKVIENKLDKYIPFISYNYTSFKKNRQLIKKLKEILKIQRIDLIYYHGVSSYKECYVEGISVKQIINLVDLYSYSYNKYLKVESNFLKKCFFWKESFFCSYMEKKIVKKFQKIILVNDLESKYANFTYKTNKFISIPIGIEKNNVIKQIDENKKNIDLVFIGNMNFKPNKDGLNYFYNEYFKKLPKNYILHIIGPNSEGVFLNDENVKMYGYVNNLDNILVKMDFGIAMMINGGGQKNKILDYIARGVPAIINNYVYENNKFESKYIYNVNTIEDFISVTNNRKELMYKSKEIKESIEKYYSVNTSRIFWNLLKNI